VWHSTRPAADWWDGAEKEDDTVRCTTQAAQIVAAIVNVRTRQLELRLQTNRRGGALVGERLYRAGELDALLADLRAELQASEEQETPLTPASPNPADA
jgi:hypothetical protein